MFTPETKELQVRESCQLGGERERKREGGGGEERGRKTERETAREKKKKKKFAPLAEFSACRGPRASPVFRCCDNQGERGEREKWRDRQREGEKKSAD